jgi:hypothetical protein
MQAVRDFLLHGPIKVQGKEYTHLVAYYVKQTKKSQKGHSCNVQVQSVAQIVASPRVALHHTLLNTVSACVCDAVHWGLVDLARRILTKDRDEEVVLLASPTTTWNVLMSAAIS